MRHPEYQYLDLLEQVLTKGDERIDRTKVGTRSIFGAMVRFDLSDGCAPILTTKHGRRDVGVRRRDGRVMLAGVHITGRPSHRMVEQFAAAALDVSDYGYVLENGRIAVQGPADRLKDDPAVKAAYLGGAH